MEMAERNMCRHRHKKTLSIGPLSSPVQHDITKRISLIVSIKSHNWLPCQGALDLSNNIEFIHNWHILYYVSYTH